jgi:uncharacterized protein (DUF488 family)
MTFFTIGYGGNKPADFVEILKTHKIKSIIDVRLRPDKASMGLYQKAKGNNKGIQKLLNDKGIEYFSFVELGNLFVDDKDSWKLKYEELLKASGELLTKNLLTLIKDGKIPQPFCLMCAEKDENECHRKQIADYLIQNGWACTHL